MNKEHNQNLVKTENIYEIYKCTMVFCLVELSKFSINLKLSIYLSYYVYLSKSVLF